MPRDPEQAPISRHPTAAIQNLDHVAWLVDPGFTHNSAYRHLRTRDPLLTLCDGLVEYLIATQR